MNIAILGSTGTIGLNALDIVRNNRSKDINVFGLSAGSNYQSLIEQIKEFKPKVVSLSSEVAASEFSKYLSSLDLDYRPELLVGQSASSEIATMPEVDCVLAGIVGFDGLESVLAAVNEGKSIALANKESLVAAGHLVMSIAKEKGAKIVPVDSEHSSLYQLLRARPKGVAKLSITASGGPFLNKPINELKKVSPEEATKHPKWKMGPKISVDSATLMNKALEVIEAKYLFEFEAEKIKVLIHPQSIVHGLVEYEDGVIEANMYQTDMRVPICYSFNEISSIKFDSCVKKLDLAEISSLEFKNVDEQKFPCLELAYEALKLGPEGCVSLNAANEVAVNSFLNKSIEFTDIYTVCRDSLDRPLESNLSGLEDIKFADSKARQLASEVVERIRS